MGHQKISFPQEGKRIYFGNNALKLCLFTKIVGQQEIEHRFIHRHQGKCYLHTRAKLGAMYKNNDEEKSKTKKGIHR
jgi:hypothetical protein